MATRTTTQAVYERSCDRCGGIKPADTGWGWGTITIQASTGTEPPIDLCTHCLAAVRFMLITDAVTVVVTAIGEETGRRIARAEDEAIRCKSCGRIPNPVSVPCKSCPDAPPHIREH